MPAHLLKDRRAVPAAAAVLMGLLGVVEAWFDPTFRDDFAVFAAGAAWITGGFVVAIRWPSAGAVVVSLFYPFTSLLGAPGPGGTGLISVMIAVAYAGYASPRDRSRLATLVCIVSFLVADGVQRGLTWDTIFFPAVFVPAWWTGTLVRREQERSRQVLALAAELDAQREASAHAAVVEERARIAREVHDSVAHSVSVMTLQIGGLRRQLQDVLVDRPGERDVMLGLERLGRQSVEELRAAVGVLREADDGVPGAPAPTLARADELVSDVRAAGLDVSLEVVGDLGELPKPLDVAGYRIAQEALTNALRHAPGSRACLQVEHTGTRLTVTVTDDGARRPAVNGAVPGGHGLVGMRERTTMYGGTLEAGPLESGGFRVRATFPVGREWA
jgi:signal transduction histidine kinase